MGRGGVKVGLDFGNQTVHDKDSSHQRQQTEKLRKASTDNRLCFLPVSECLGALDGSLVHAGEPDMQRLVTL